MNKKILTTLFLSTLISATIFAQYPRASLWTSTMANFAAQDAANGTQKNGVLFTGSSTFTMWSSLQTDFPESKVLNRAFGGSMMTDLLYYFNQVVLPYQPRQVVLYEGDNDLHETSKTPEEFMDDVIAMTRLINIHFPSAEIVLVSIKPSPSRTASFSKYLAANSLMKAYADKYSHLTYVDMWAHMLRFDGTPETSYFGPDMLHMNASGYVLWKDILKPYLLSSDFEVPDKTVFTESSHAGYHDFSWVSATAPSIFQTTQTGKISTSNTIFNKGASSLKLEYQGKEGGDWKACVAGTDWALYDLEDSKSLEFWIYSAQEIAAADLPQMFFETTTGANSGKLAMSNYSGSIKAAEWKRVAIPLSDWRAISPTFDYSKVKTLFFSQLSNNNALITLYIDDIIFKADNQTTNPNAKGDIFIDFGSSAAGFPTPGNWNNLHDHQAANANLIDDNGDDTDIMLEITDPFYNGFNTSGPTTVSGDAAIFVGTATSDNFFGHGLLWGTNPANPKAAFTLKGLDPAKYYSFSIFASRMGSSDNREAQYWIVDKNGIKSAKLNASDNTTKVANIPNVQASAAGEIEFNVEASEENNNSNKFFYLGAIRISTSNFPSNVKALSDKTDMQAYYNNGLVQINQYTGPVQVFNMNGKTIASGQSIFGTYALNLQKGVYVLTTLQGNAKITVL